MKKFLSIILAALLCSSLAACGQEESSSSTNAQSSAGTAESTTDQGDPSEISFEEPVEFTLYRVWNGSSISAPDPEQDIIAPILKEKFNTTINFKYAADSESQILNLMFASGDMPEVIDAPFWGGADASTTALKKAASEGYLLPIGDYIRKYVPRLEEALNGNYAKDVLDFDLHAEEFSGKEYLLPLGTYQDYKKGVKNSLGTPVIRKDIAEALNIKPEEITTSEQLYDVLKQIKEGGFKDITGNDVIPSSIMGGTGFVGMANSYADGGKSDFYWDEEEQRYILDMFGSHQENIVLYLNKLYTEDLLDKECFSENGSSRDQKIATGKIGVISWNGLSAINMARKTLNQTNPEMEYVPIGPIINSKGEPYTSNQIQVNGHNGSAVLAITTKANETQIQRVMAILDFVNTDEGRTLLQFGIEGEQYEVVDDLPSMLPPYDEYVSSGNLEPLTKIGLRGSYFSSFNTYDDLKLQPALQQGDPNDPSIVYNEQIPIKFVEGYNLNFLGNSWEDTTALNEVNTLINDFLNLRKQAVVAASQEEAKALLDNFKSSAAKNESIIKYMDYVNEKAAEYDKEDIIE
ncbi:MAG: hypothetical protein ACOX6P_09010 [Candidatus Merdivicinus sp.]|jgi:putative aldouronate transport system substrate-binding protein